MFGKKSNDNGEKLYRYSIRKYHFGAASVAVAALMFFANGAVKADTLPVSPVTANTEKVNAGVTGLTEGVPPKENIIEKSKEVESDKTPAAQKQVDKSPLVQAISELQAAIAKVDEESLLSLSNQLSQLTDENKRLLDGENISKEALASQVIRVQSLTEQVRQLKSKTEDKTSNKEDRADSKAQNTKELKVSDKAVTPTNQAEEIKAVQKDENKGEDTANKDKLEALSKSLITYLDTAKKIERPETKKLLEGVEETVRSVENGLANPKLTASEIEELMKQGKQAEKKLALAVTREHSGKRDSLNGNKMLPESYFRAPNTREGANTEFGNAYTAWMITNDDVRRFQSAGINDPNYHGYNYPVGTFLYNSNNAENSPINNNNMQGPQRIAWTRNRVYVQVNRVSGNEQTGYEFNWKIQFNNGHEPHQKPFYYFTLPDGHNFSSSVVLKENESQIATGTIDDVLQKSQGLLNGKMGTTEGVNGGEYYKGTGLINGRPYIQAPIRTLEDFVKNSTNYYFNRSGVNGDIIQKSDFLFENIRNSTKNIIAIQPQGRNSGGFNHSYSFEFTTHSNSGDAPYYVAGVKTYETTLGLTQHRSYSQWGTLKDAYTIKTDSFTNGDFKKKTFLKGTQLGAFENSAFSFTDGSISVEKGNSFIDAGLVLRNNTTGRDERPQKGKLLLKITPTATIDGANYSHIHNFYNYKNPNDALTNSKDRTKGGHLAYLEGTYNGSTIKLPFSFNIVTQSDIFEPVKNEAKENQARKTTDNLGNASDFISGYKNISNRIPDLFTNWNEGNPDTFRNIFKGDSNTFPGSSNDIKNRAIKNVEWADGNSNLTGEKIVPVKVRYTPQGEQAYEETKYVTLPPELNNLSIGQVLTDSQKQKIIELAKTTFDADSASFDTNAAKVGVKKQVKITYMDNEKNASTGNKDDSVRYVDFHFTNLTVPDSNKPVVTMNGRTLTTNAEENQFIIYRGAAFNPTFNVTDESRIGSLMVRNLPKGVYFNKVDNVDKERVGTTTTLNHTISGDDSNKVADDATLGEQIALVEASDRYGNSATYKFKYRIVDIQAKNSTTENRTVGSTLGNPKNNFKVAESDTVENNKYYPDGMQFKWKEIDLRNARITDVANGTQLNELGTITKYTATAVFPSVKNTKEIDRVNYTIYSPTQKAIPITFNVKPNAPTISQPQFNGTAGTRPNVTVGNLPTNAQLQNGATVTVELYQGTTKVASKTVTDRNGTTTLSAENFTANLAEGQQVHAVVKVSGGQGATAYSVSSDNSERRNVTGYNLVARDIINVKQGERLTQDELNKLIQVQEGNTLQDLPQGATVTATLDTATIANGGEETKTAEATVDFGQGRTKKLNIRYRVLRTFPVANLVYDFYGQPRGDNEASYYSNTRGLPSGMDWYLKKGNQNQPTSKIQDYLKNDPIGSTEYTFGAKYNAGRFTNSPKADDKLKHEGSLVHKVFDVMPNPTKVTVDQGASLSDKQAKDAVIKVANSENLPEGTTYEWVNASGVRENARATTSGKQTFHVKITLPKSQVTGSDLPGATQVQPSKTIAVTVNVTPPKPTFDTAPVTSTSRTITGTLGGLNASAGKAVVRVALNDASGRVLTSENNGGVTINGNTWTATLPNDVKLRQSVQKNGENVKPANLTVTTTIAGTQLSRQGDDKVVQMGSYAITPAIAGSKHIDITVPHDAKRVELRFHNSEESGNKTNSIVLVRSQNGGDWHVDAVRTDHTAVSDANKFVAKIENGVSRTNASENLVRIHLKEIEGGSKLHLKEEVANGSGTSTYGKGLGLRVAYQSEAGQDPVTAGNWMIANISNTSPTLEYKGTEGRSDTTRKVFPSGTSITKEKLAELVTIRDTEDNHTVLEDKPYGTGSLQIMSGLTETPGKATPAGRYTVVLKAIDSQGKESNTLTVHVGVVSTDLKYQPKVKGINVGNSKEITITGATHQNGESITYTPIEKFTESGKQYVLKAKGPQTAHLTDEAQVFNIEYVEDFEPSVPTDKVPAKNASQLSPTEKAAVKEKVAKANEGKTIGEPSADGTVTVTDPTTGISHEIPGSKLVNQDFEPSVPTDKVPVKDKSHLTPEEKKQVADNVKGKNPGKEVTVSDDGTATVTDPTTGISHTIPGTDLVNQDFEPVKPTEKVPVKDLNNLSKDEQDKVKESVEKANPGKTVVVEPTGKVTITDPETNVTHNIPRDELLFAYAKGEPEVLENPEFSGGVNAPDSPIHEVPEFNGGVNGEPETQEELPKFNGGVNTPDSPIHERPDFTGGVNGELPEPTELPKVSLIITKWIDENGNDLKQPDAKAPSVPGEANEAFEHGEIEGYVFVRTETKGDVVTHVFRKVSQVRPTGDGQQRPATPSDVTNSRPNTANPAEVPATQPTEQPSQTVEVPTQLPNEVSETDSSVSQPQAVLPNTGTQEVSATGALGFLSLLGTFGLLFAKKKKDDEEEA